MKASPLGLLVSATLDEVIYIYDLNGFCFRGQGFDREFSCLGLSMEFLKLEFLGKVVSFERRQGGGDSKAPHPASSVPHLDVNADGG